MNKTKNNIREGDRRKKQRINKVTAGKRSSDFPLTLILAHFETSHCASHCAV